MNLESALRTFVTESHELLQEMEGLLLNLNLNSIKQDEIDSIFARLIPLKALQGFLV